MLLERATEFVDAGASERIKELVVRGRRRVLREWERRRSGNRLSE
jgi:hypothetical protein